MIGAVLIVGIGLVAGLITTENNVGETVEGDLAVIANMADSLITSELNLLREKDVILASNLADIYDEGALREILAAQLDTLEYKDFIGLTVFDRDGLVVSVGPYPASDEFRDGEYAKHAFSGQAVFSTVMKTHRSDRLVLHISAPVREGVILVATVDGLFFHNFLKDFKIWETGHVFVIDKEGCMISNPRENWIHDRFNPIAASETDPEYESAAVVMKKMIAGESGLGRYTIGGVERVCVYRPVTGSLVGWSLGAVAPLPESPMNDVEKGFFLVAIICLALCVLVAFIISIPIAGQFRKIDELKKEAESASKAKSGFLANMSHELRTPLNAIIGLSELALSGNSSKEERVENITKVYTAGVTMLGLINDILDISKIESGKFEILPTKYDVSSVINDTVSLNIVRIGSRPIDFHVHVDENLPALLIGDDIRVKQIFNNFLSNAFKYTKEGSVDWRITFERDGDEVTLISIVKDTGIGITPEDIGRLFSAFGQVDTKANRGTEGTGLGLSITKSLIEMMGGTITVESEYGVGSTFTARFKQQYADDRIVGREIAEKLRDFRYFDQKRDRSSKLVRHQMPYARVLVVDDVRTNLDVARGMLKPYGMAVDLVTSGQDAIDLIRKGEPRYDVVFMDHMMPEMDGVEATRIIREEIGTAYAKTVTVIALTANSILGSEEMFLAHGFQAFLSKPIDMVKLDAMVNTWVRNKDLERKAGRYETAAPEAADPAAAPSKDVCLEAFATLPGFDAANAFAKFGGETESFVSILQSYVKNTPPLLDELRGVNETNLPAYAITVHGVKGSSRGICADDIGRDAEALELAAKKGNLGFVLTNNAAFLEKTAGFIDELRAALDRVAREGETRERAQRPAPDAALLEALAAAAAAFDVETAEAVLTQMEAFDYAEGGELVEELRDQLDRGDFAALAGAAEAT
jgi:signal transduction histidine kinase/CheY-like chemotaxis protein